MRNWWCFCVKIPCQCSGPLNYGLRTFLPSHYFTVSFQKFLFRNSLKLPCICYSSSFCSRNLEQIFIIYMGASVSPDFRVSVCPVLSALCCIQEVINTKFFYLFSCCNVGNENFLALYMLELKPEFQGWLFN